MADIQWESAASLFTKFGVTDLSDLCHLTAEGLLSDSVIKPDKYLSIVSLEEWWQLIASLKWLLKMAVNKGWTRDQISEHLGDLGEASKKAIIDAVSVHQNSLKHKLVQDTTAVSHAVLSHFDWKLRLAMSSDKLASLQEPYLLLDLDVKEAGGTHKQLALELDTQELTRLITSLEACSKSVQQLSTPP